MPRLKVKWEEVHEEEFDIPEGWDIERVLWTENYVPSLLEVNVLETQYLGKSEPD